MRVVYAGIVVIDFDRDALEGESMVEVDGFDLIHGVYPWAYSMAGDTVVPKEVSFVSEYLASRRSAAQTLKAEIAARKEMLAAARKAEGISNMTPDELKAAIDAHIATGTTDVQKFNKLIQVVKQVAVHILDVE